jgi:hypothetical protein
MLNAAVNVAITEPQEVHNLQVQLSFAITWRSDKLN